MKISTQLAIIEDYKHLPPRSLTRKDLNDYLATRRSTWGAPKSLDVDTLITLLGRK